MIFKKYLLKFDLLGKTQNLTISKRDTYPTYLGSIISLIIIIVLGYFLFYFGLQIINKDKLNLVTTVYNIDNPPKTFLNDSVIALTFAIQNPDYSVYINESIYTLQSTMHTITIDDMGNSNEVLTPVPMIKCSEYTFKVIPEYFKLQDLDNLYCIGSTENIYLQGEYGKSTYSYINFEFSRCVNTTENNNTCKSEEEINSRLTGGYLGMFISDLSIIPNNYEHPSNIYGKNLFTSFSGKQYTDAWLTLKEIEVNTDCGLIINEIKTENFIAYNSLVTTSDNREGAIFLTLNLRMSQTKEIYDRSYDKLQSVAAELGGIMKFCFVCGEVAVYIIRELLYRDYILSFFFEDNSKNERERRSIFNEKSFNNSNSILPMSNSIFLYSPKKKPGNPDTNISKNVVVSPDTNISKNVVVSPQGSISKRKKSTNIRNSISHNMVSKRSNKSMKETQKKSQHLMTLTSCSFFGCLFSKETRNNISNVYYKYQRIGFLFDVIHYLKSKDDIASIKKIVFDENQNKFMLRRYSFVLNDKIEEDLFNYSLKIPKRVIK